MTAQTLCLVVQANVAVAQVGIMPIPQIDTAEVETTVEIVKAAGGEPTQYIYRYAVTNPATSSDEYYKFGLDISAEVTDFAFPSPNLFFPTLQTHVSRHRCLAKPAAQDISVFPANGFQRGMPSTRAAMECERNPI